MKTFNELVEAKKETKEPIRLLIVSAKREDDKPFITAGRLQDEAKKKGLESFIANIEECIITKDDDTGITTISNSSDPEEFVIDANTIAIIRGTVARKDSFMDLISQLEKIGVPCVNNRETIHMCADKYWSSIKLRDSVVPQPKTALVRSKETLQDAIDSIDLEYPFIMKTLRGSKGVGVMFVESERSLKALVAVLYKLDEDVELIVQEFIESDGDVRVQVLGNEIIGAMKRVQIKGDFRSNISQGAEGKPFKLTDEQKEICINAHKSVNGAWTAVDFIVNEKGETFVLEVNSSPGTAGFEDATGVNVAKLVIEHFEERVNWRRTPSQIGKLESIEVDGIGKVVAKFDTGNGSISPSIHATDIEVKGKQVSWKHHGKTMKSKILRTVEVQKGGLQDYSEDRYAINLTFHFNGVEYADYEFLLDNRGDRSGAILMNRKFMQQINVMVNPSRNYVVSEKVNDDRGQN